MIVDAITGTLKINTDHVATYEQKDADRWLCRGPGNHFIGVISPDTMARIEKETNFPMIVGHSPFRELSPRDFKESADQYNPRKEL